MATSTNNKAPLQKKEADIVFSNLKIGDYYTIRGTVFQKTSGKEGREILTQKETKVAVDMPCDVIRLKDFLSIIKRLGIMVKDKLKDKFIGKDKKR